MSVRRRVITAVLTAAAVVVSGLGAAAPASAGTSTALPWSTFGHVLADAHGHVYVTGGHGADGVWVRHADGSADTTITGEAGASGMTLSADGSTLYVALLDAAAIAAISTTTLTETARFATTGHCPDSLALLGSTVWFSSRCVAVDLGGLGVVDLSSSAVAYTEPTLGGSFLLAVPGDATSLLVATRSQSYTPTTVTRFSVSGSTLTQTAFYAGSDPINGTAVNLGGMAIDPDGTHVVIGCGAPNNHLKLRLSDLAVDGSYTANTYPNAVATSTVAGGIVAGGVLGIYNPDVWIYRAGNFVRTYSFDDVLAADGLALSPDASRLYAISTQIGGGLPLFHVLDDPGKAPSTLSLVGPSQVAPGHGVHLTGSLVDTVGPIGAVTLTVSRTVGSTTTPMPDVVTAVDGSYTVDDTLGTSDATYTTHYAGDATRGAATATVQVLAVKSVTTLTLNGPASVVPGGAVALTGSLTDPDGAVAAATLSVTRDDGTGATPLPDAVTASDGSYSVNDTAASAAISYTVSYAGDSSHTPSQATKQVAVVKNASSITIVAPTTGTRGVAYTVSGILSGGGAPVVGATVALKRTDLVGTKTLSLKTNASGGYSYRDVPAVGGPVTWTASWVGDATNAAVTKSRVVTIARAATALSIKASASSYKYGAKATVTVHLGTTYNRRDVYVYARPLAPGGPAAPGTLISHVRVNSLGNAVISYTMRSRTTFTVRFVGDYRYAVAARAVTPNVVTTVPIETTGYSAKSGSTYLFKGSIAYFRASTRPLRTSGCVSFQAQALRRGSWVSAGTLSCAAIQGDYFAYAIANRILPGTLFRIRAVVGSTSYSLGGTSAWITFKFA